MENQPEVGSFAPENDQSALSGELERAWWQVLGEEVDLGLFFAAGQDKPVYLNSILGDWLGFQGAAPENEGAFWEAVSMLSADPDRTRSHVAAVLEKRERKALVQIPLQEDPGISFSIQLFSNSRKDHWKEGYGGFVTRGRDANPQTAAMGHVFRNLLLPARQLSASAVGNMQALGGNLHSWSPDVLEQFHTRISDQLSKINHFLDLGLSYTKIIEKKSLYFESVDVINLLERVIHENGYSTITLVKHQLVSGQQLAAKIDRAMLRITFEILLKEIVLSNPPGQLSEVRLSKGNGCVVVRFDSPRTLPLPGLEEKTLDQEVFEVNPELFLAQEILAAQGGGLLMGNRTAEEGGGVDIEVSLPSEKTPEPQSTRRVWRDLFHKRSGRILLAEAQPEYQIRIREALTEVGYRVDMAPEGSSVLDLVQTRSPDLVILDRNLPGMDGLLVTQGIRRWSAVPIIMTSNRGSKDDLLYAYRLGVDDYLNKPFLIEELLAKVEVFITRQENTSSAAAPEIYQEGSIRIDHGSREVWVRGNPVELTPIEYNLLVYLSRQGRQIIPYEQLLEHVWEGPEKGTRQGLFVHVRRLREKIELDPKSPVILGNKWGVGYVFNP